MQTLLVGLAFLLAVGYMLYRLYRSFRPGQAACSKNCGCALTEKPTPKTIDSLG